MRLSATLILLALSLPCPVGAQVELVVIVHPSVKLDTLSKGELLDYYTGDTQCWPDGEAVVVKDLGEKGDVRDGFYRFLGKRPSRMKSIWLRMMLSGEGEPPESLDSEESMLAAVARTPGALGFVGRTHVTDQVRVLMLISGDRAHPPPRDR
ncbi:MAG TPA: hypothetical protein QGF95_01655 [Candidatus Latescibacteria bacterium]|nr:hypothetical protein [Candidatus Latescibacterota bacterium]